MDSFIINVILGALLLCSVILNVSLILYIRNKILRIFFASEEVSQILTRLDSFHSHLKSVYEMEMFYGDDTLKSLIDHLRSLILFLARYEEVYSFTQPDLLDQLEAVDEQLDNYGDEEAQKEEE
jgi:hypothetical protein